MEIKSVKIEEIKLDPNNARKHSEKNLAAISASLEKFGQRKPIVVHNGVILAGNGTYSAACSLGWEEIAIVEVPSEWDSDTAKAYALADNRTAELAEWDTEHLAKQLLELDEMGWEVGELGFDVPEKPEDKTEKPSISLAEKFLVPPFSVLDTRAGYWQQRKRMWLDYGIKSEEGRKKNLLNFSKTINPEGLTSIFDPVLCEIAYRWFTAPDSQILDPFAGGSVRGITAAYLGHNYLGLELSETQVKANEQQADGLLEDKRGLVSWIIGDSNKSLDALPEAFEADLIMSCPPYADLEVYSDDPDDISNMPYPDFLEIYRSIIAKAASKLKEDRFAFWVVTEVRDKKTGLYRNFVPDTIEAFEDAGLSFYNDIILLSPVGNAAMRAGNFFTNSRKLGRIHQNVLVFVKGDPKKATEFCGEVDFTTESTFFSDDEEAGWA